MARMHMDIILYTVTERHLLANAIRVTSIYKNVAHSYYDTMQKLCIILTKGQSNFPKGDMSRMQKKSVTSGTPIWRRGGPRGSAMVPFERAMVVSHRLSIVAVALSVTIRPQFAIGCLQRLYQPCWVILGVKFGEEGVDRCKPNFNTIWKSCGAAVWKKL